MNYVYEIYIFTYIFICIHMILQHVYVVQMEWMISLKNRCSFFGAVFVSQQVSDWGSEKWG